MNDTQNLPGGAETERLRAFLESAPDELRDWAENQIAQLADSPTVADEFDDFDDDEELLQRPKSNSTAKKRPKPKSTAKKGGKKNRVNLILVTLLVAAVVIIVQQIGHPVANSPELPEGHPSIGAGAEVSVPAVDKETEKALLDRAHADPNDLEARKDLGKLYFDAGLYQDAITYFEQANQLAPNDVEVLLMLGVCQYSINDFDSAEQTWLQATKAAPEKAEPWYNLGFLYVAKTPPDYDAARKSWEKVIALEPNSELAASTKDHLGRLNAGISPSPTMR